MKTVAPLRLGLVGLKWGERTAFAAQDMTGVTLGSCYARSTADCADFARRYGCKPCESFEQMLEDESLTAIVVMTPNGWHRTHAVAALEAGKHVLVTKPIATTLADATAMIKAAEANGRILAIGHQSRRHPAMRELKRMLVSDVLGRLQFIEGNASGEPPAVPPGSDNWRARAEECPGGALLQLGIHYVDNFQYLLGPIESVFSLAPANDQGLAGGGVTLSALTFSGDVVGYLGSSYTTNYTRWIRLSGSRATASYDIHRGLVLEAKGSIDRLILPSARAAEATIRAAVFDELAEFVRCIRDGTEPEIGGAEGRRNLAVVLAAVKSAKITQSVNVEQFMREQIRSNATH